MLQDAPSKEPTLGLDSSAIDVDNYIPEARPYIFKAISAPLSLPPNSLKEVCCCIVNRAWEDTTYFLTAAKLCVYIAEKEKATESGHVKPKFTFRASLLENIQLITTGGWREMRAHDKQYWISFCQFLAHLYVLLVKVDIRPSVLEAEVFSVMDRLSATPSTNDDELELFCWMVETCGPSLAKTDHIGHNKRLNSIMNKCRDLFLDSDLQDTRIRQRLLLVIEFQASGWLLSTAAKNFYRPFTSANS